MINEIELLNKLEKRLDAYIAGCGYLTYQKADGYAKCFNDVTKIIEEMAEDKAIKKALGKRLIKSKKRIELRRET